ncbi:MAG: metal-sensitive transcriptional regulator [Proteobacteria bacterium]|nr:metal-sensitive transcriptional regulator [Pseudomonadota bacterium]
MQAESDARKKIATRLARIEGQLRGVKALVQNGADCEQVAVQMTAARRALDRAFYEMLACSFIAHVEDGSGPAELRASSDELARLLVKLA